MAETETSWATIIRTENQNKREVRKDGNNTWNYRDMDFGDNSILYEPY
jgi:hypothetical protein